MAENLQKECLCYFDQIIDAPADLLNQTNKDYLIVFWF